MKKISTKRLQELFFFGKIAALAFLLLMATQQVWSQVSVTTSTMTYTQNFNSFNGSSAASMPANWTISGTFRGTGTGTVNTGGVYAYGNAPDYSVGYLGSGSAGSITFSVSFVNNTGLPITKLDVGFNFEQWRVAAASPTNTNGFIIAGTGALAGNSTLVSGLATNSCACGSSGTATITPKSVTLTNLNIANGAVFGIQWSASDGSGTDNGFSVDDFALTAYNPKLAASALTDFGNACLNVAKGPNSFTITGTDLTTAAVTVGPRAGFTYSTTAAGTYTTSLSLTHAAGAYSQVIYAKFTPTAVQSYDGNIAVGGGNATSINVAAAGDGVAPVVNLTSNSPVCEGSDLNLDATGSTGTPLLSYSWTGPASFTSNTGTPTVTSMANANAGSYSVEVTDGDGCKATKSITVAVDKVITAPAAVTAHTDASSCTATSVALGTPVTSTNCTVANVTNDAPSAFPVGATTVTWSATVGGNTFTATQLVTVSDNVNPTITAPSAVSVNTDAGICTASSVALGTPVTADNCTVANVTNDAPATFPAGATNVTWTVTDAAGNTATAIQVVTVTDIINPTITAPSAVSANTDASSCTATSVVLGTPVTADNCTVANVTNDAPSAFPVGTTTVTWTVTDAAGNTAIATQEVTVTDNVNPTITAPAAVSVNADAGSCDATSVTLGTPVTADNCTVANVTNDAPTTFPGGATTVTWTVTDAAGNIATATQEVTVTDNENPTITAPPAVSVNVDAGSCDAASVTLGIPVTADNCTVANVTNDAPTSFPSGATMVTWTVTDAAGNTATATQEVIVTDNVNPTITAPAAVSVNADAGSCEATGIALGTPVTADNCTVATVTNDAPTSFPSGATTVTWTVTDAAGNIATTTQEVTVNASGSVIPTVSIIADVNTAFCEGTSVMFTATPVFGGSTPTYQWFVNSVDQNTNASVFTSSNLADDDVVSCTMTSSIACANPSIAISNAITSEVNAAPAVTVVTLPVNATVCNGEEITLTASGATSYTWDGGISNGVVFTPAQSGAYIVTATDANGCEGTATVNVTVQTCTSVESVDANKLSFNVYPNPSNGEFNINFDAAIEAQITVLDLMGKVKYTGSVKEGNKQIDIKDLSKGVYVVRLENGSKEMIKLITIE